MVSDPTPFQTRTKLQTIYGEHVRQIWQGEDPYPVAMEVNLSNFCNQGCHWCISEKVRSKAYLDISDPAIERFFRDFRRFGGKALSWSGGGEPTLHPKFETAIELISNIGLDQGLVTHGAFPERLVRPIARHCKWIRISLDTHKPEDYAAKRGTKLVAFDRAVANATSLVKQGVKVGVNMNVARWNVDHIKGVYDLASRISADYLQIRPTLPTPFASIQHEELLRTDNINKIMEDAIAIRDSGPSSTQLIVSIDKFDDLRKRGLERQYQGCKSHRIFVVLDWTGDLMVCMYHLGDKRFSFGNVYTQSLPEIWKSATRAKVLEFCGNQLDHTKDGCQMCCKGHEINKVLFGTVEIDSAIKATQLDSFL